MPQPAPGHPPPAKAIDAGELLKLQYINGDIDERDYLRKRTVLDANEVRKVIEILEPNRTDN